MLISKESLLKKFESGALLFEPAVRKIIEDEPEAMVRCRDCRWKLGTYCSRFEYCPMTDEDFCSRGERRTDE